MYTLTGCVCKAKNNFYVIFIEIDFQDIPILLTYNKGDDRLAGKCNYVLSLVNNYKNTYLYNVHNQQSRYIVFEDVYVIIIDSLTS